eukprot:5398913-Amphidinium_carterae.1
MGKGHLPTSLVFPDQWTDRVASKAMPVAAYADLRGVFRGKGKGSAKGSGPISFGGSTSSLASPSVAISEVDPQEPTVDEPEPEYHVGMMEGAVGFAGWAVVETVEAGRVGGPDTALPGGSAPGLRNPDHTSSSATGSLKD